MAAGQGFKTFTTGEVLTAGDVNGYLMQGINVFADATARDAAITAPAEGQFAFTKDNNSLWYYDGAAWVASGATGDIEGVTASSPLTGGGTSGTVTVGIQDASTSQRGSVQLSDSTSTTDSTLAATSTAVKSAYDLAAAAIPKSTVTTNGDLIYGTGSGTVTRLGVGSSGQVLTVSGGVPSWGTVSAGGNWSLLGSAALTGANTITISGISGKNQLLILIQGASSNTAAEGVSLRFNSDSSSNYNSYGVTWGTPSSYTAGALQSNGSAGSNIKIGDMANNASSAVNGYCFVDGCNTSGLKVFKSAGTGNTGGSTGQYSFNLGGFYNSGSTISSVSAITGTTFDAGTMYVYSSVN